MRTITASAPGKLLLLGEHAVVHGHPCLVTAVEQRIFVSVEKNGKDVFYMEAPDLGLTAYSKTIESLAMKAPPPAVRFVEHLYRRFLERWPQKEGIVVKTRSEFSSAFGFGSSSAVSVAFAKALTTLYEIPLTDNELFELCYRAVIDVQGVGSGFDIASAIWGGTLYYVPPAQVVRKITINELPFVVGYTGIKADTPTLVRMVQSLHDDERERVSSWFGQIERLVNKAEAAIAKNDWQELGSLMMKNQSILRKLQVSSRELNRLNRAAVKAGAFGAKLSGAGGGDCMLAVVSDEARPRVKQALELAGGEVLEVSLNAEGVRLEV
jgi:mevalonate kinase